MSQLQTKPSFFQRLLFIGSKPGGPQWQPRDKRFQTWWLLRLLLVLVLATTIIVIYWVVIQDVQAVPVKPLPAGVDLAVVLAPVLAAAAGIERFLETLFSVLEGNWRTLVAYLGRGMRWLQNAETEVESARQWLTNISAQYNDLLKQLPGATTTPVNTQAASTTPPADGQPGAPPGATVNPQDFVKVAQEKLDAAKALMDVAEERLKRAEDQLGQVTSSDGYRNAKKASSIYLGLLLGLIVATAGSLQMFALMGVNVGHAKIDVIITGLVIGSGSAPVHSLINILQSVKDTLDSTKGWINSKKG